MKPDREKAPPGSEPGKGRTKPTKPPRHKVPAPCASTMAVRLVEWSAGKSVFARHDWYMVHLLDHQISERYRRVAFVIMAAINDETGTSWKSHITIAQEAKCGVSTVARATKALTNRRWLTVEKRKGKSSVYRLSFAPDLVKALSYARQKAADDGVTPVRAEGSTPVRAERTPPSGLNDEQTKDRREEQTKDGHSAGGDPLSSETPTPREVERQPERPCIDPIWLDPENPFLSETERIVAVFHRAGVKVEWAA